MPIEEQVDPIMTYHLGVLTEVRFSQLFAPELQALYSR